ncbi:MAG: heavy metal-binding domain-containing protein [Candidatus Aminicenantales bacterium]
MKHSKILALFLALAFVTVLSGIAQQQAGETVTCPVSGKQIKKSEAKATYEYEGKTYYFCCEKCKEEFIKNPEKYTKKKEEAKEVYTCPMHPEVKSDKPGKCPKCGMKLEKKMMPMKRMHAPMKMHKKEEGKACCPMMGMMSAKDIEFNVENVENGVVVKVTSKNADVVKKIQEYAARMKQMCESACKKEAKKEEVKK